MNKETFLEFYSAYNGESITDIKQITQHCFTGEELFEFASALITINKQYNMKKKIYNWLFKLSKKNIAINIVKYGTQLTPQYLIERGWVVQNGYFIKPNLKDRDRISISFEGNYYRVWHSETRTFFAMESTVEWFELYYLLAHVDNGRYKLAGI